jgi:hypothetical protein
MIKSQRFIVGILYISPMLLGYEIQWGGNKWQEDQDGAVGILSSRMHTVMHRLLCFEHNSHSDRAWIKITDSEDYPKWVTLLIGVIKHWSGYNRVSESTSPLSALSDSNTPQNSVVNYHLCREADTEIGHLLIPSTKLITCNPPFIYILHLVETKGFWRWFIALWITGLADYIHRPEF